MYYGKVRCKISHKLYNCVIMHCLMRLCPIPRTDNVSVAINDFIAGPSFQEWVTWFYADYRVTMQSRMNAL